MDSCRQPCLWGQQIPSAALPWPRRPSIISELALDCVITMEDLDRFTEDVIGKAVRLLSDALATLAEGMLRHRHLVFAPQRLHAAVLHIPVAFQPAKDNAGVTVDLARKGLDGIRGETPSADE